MKIVIVNAYNRHNAGDAALLSALIGQVGQAFPDSDICFAGLESPVEYPDFEGARNVGSIRHWAGADPVRRSRRILRKAVAIGLSLLPASALRGLLGGGSRLGRVEPLGEIRAIAEADLVIGLGGGYLNGSATLAGTLNVCFILLPVWLATRLGRPTVLAPQSYGPFGRPSQTRLVRLCLNRVDRIVVREDLSLDVLRAVGVREDLLERGVDGAFAVGTAPGSGSPCPEEPGQPRVGITARAWMNSADQDSYERSLARFIDWLQQSRGASVTLIPQVTSDYQGDDDRLVSRRVASHCSSSPEVINGRLDHVALRAMYRDLDYVVGTRFHSVIFSLTNLTPALAIEYEHKTSGIMGDLGLADWVIPIEEVTAARLCNRFAAMEAAKPDYEKQLQEAIPDYVGRARDFAEVLRRSVP